MQKSFTVLTLAITLCLTGSNTSLWAQQPTAETLEFEGLNFDKNISRADLSRIVQARALGLPDQASEQEINDEGARLSTLHSAKAAGIDVELPIKEIGRLLIEKTNLEGKRALGLPDTASIELENEVWEKYQARKSQMIQRDQEEMAKIPLSNQKERDRLYFTQSARMDQLERQYVARQIGLPENSTAEELQEFQRKETRSRIARLHGLADNLTDDQLSAVIFAVDRFKQRQIAISILKEKQSITDASLHRKMAILSKLLNITSTQLGGHGGDQISAYETIHLYASDAPLRPFDVNRPTHGLTNK